MLLSAVSVLVVAQSSSEIPEGLMNNSVYEFHPQILILPTKLSERILAYVSPPNLCCSSRLPHPPSLFLRNSK